MSIVVSLSRARALSLSHTHTYKHFHTHTHSDAPPHAHSHTPIHPFTHSPIHSLTHPFTHSPTHPLNRPLTHTAFLLLTTRHAEPWQGVSRDAPPGLFTGHQCWAGGAGAARAVLQAAAYVRRGHLGHHGRVRHHGESIYTSTVCIRVYNYSSVIPHSQMSAVVRNHRSASYSHWQCTLRNDFLLLLLLRRLAET